MISYYEFSLNGIPKALHNWNGIFPFQSKWMGSSSIMVLANILSIIGLYLVHQLYSDCILNSLTNIIDRILLIIFCVVIKIF